MAHRCTDMESQFENDLNYQLRRMRMPMLYHGGRRLVMSVQGRVKAYCPYPMVTGIRRGDAHRLNKGKADTVGDQQPIVYIHFLLTKRLNFIFFFLQERLHIMSLRYNKRFSHIKNVKHKDKGWWYNAMDSGSAVERVDLILLGCN